MSKNGTYKTERGGAGSATAPLCKEMGNADTATLFLRLFIGVVLFTQAITKSQQYPFLEGEYPAIGGLSAAEVVSAIGVLELVAGGLLITVGAIVMIWK